MKINAKKIIAFVMAFTIVMGSFAFAIECPTRIGVYAEAAEDEGFNYIVSNGEATVMGLSTALGGEIIIPSTLGGYPVTEIGYYALGNNADITSVTVPEGVKTIGNYAFSGSNNLTEVKLPDSLTTIVGSAFRLCIGLTKIDIPENVTYIGERAFFGCLNLKSITIGDSVEDIGYSAFEETGYYLNQDNWEDGILYIGKYLIKADRMLSGECFIKDGTKIIAEDAFKHCNKITNIFIPNSVTQIGTGAFGYCNSLYGVALPYGIKEISNEMFYSCKGLSTIALPETVTTIGMNAFAYCEKLKDINIPTSVTEIGETAFSMCDGLTEISLPDGIKTVAKGAFQYCDNLVKVTIPGTLETISEYMFSGCGKLSDVTIFNGVKTIQNGVFYGCNSLHEIEIPESVTSIGKNVFLHCDNLKTINVSEKNNCYSNDNYGVLFDDKNETLICYPPANSATTYTVPQGVKIIEGNAFYECLNLRRIILCEGLESIGEDAFFWLNIDEINIPASVKNIERNFLDCRNLNKFAVNSESIYYSNDEHGVLYNKDKTAIIRYPSGKTVMNYDIPSGVTTISPYAFFRSLYLEKITVPETVTIISDHAFSCCQKLKNVNIPSKIKKIEEAVFQDCDSLINYNIPEGVETIEQNAFWSCDGLKTISIPSSVNYIDINSFIFCKKLEKFIVSSDNQYYTVDDYGALFNIEKTVLIQFPAANKTEIYYVPNTVEKFDENAFEDCSKLKKLHIPDSVKSIYSMTGNKSLTDIYYEGSPKEWDLVYPSRYDHLNGVKVHYGRTDETATVRDDETLIKLEYTQNLYDGVVDISVKESFDGTAFDMISSEINITQNIIYDIKMTVDGVEKQPVGKVKVKIPVPYYYNPATTYIYHVNTETGEVENMQAEYVNGYLVFETDHFSYYAIVEGYYNSTVSIKNRVDVKNINYGETLRLTVITTDMPADAKIYWYVNGEKMGEGETFDVTLSKGSVEVTVKLVDTNGNVFKNVNGEEISDSETVSVNSSFWQKIVSFFKNLFGMNRTVVQAIFKGVF